MILKVIKKKLELNNCFSLILEKPAGFNFYAGQYLDMELPVKDKDLLRSRSDNSIALARRTSSSLSLRVEDLPFADAKRKLGNSRTFTISSSPSESFLMITSKKGVTPFKKAMEKLKEGDLITTTHPIGTFTLDESSPAVFIAGGVGITPFRSIIKHVADNDLSIPPSILIYINSDANFLFKEKLDSWVKRIPNLKIFYHDTSKNFGLDLEGVLKLYPLPFTLYPIFYLAGAPKMVDDFEKILLDLGVDQTNIRYDRFDGYMGY